MKTLPLFLALASANYIRVPLEYDFQMLSANVSFGTPGAEATVNVDTGSSETWVNTRFTKYDPSSSATFSNVTTSIPYHLEYMDGKSFDGYQGRDQVILGGNVVPEAYFGVVDADGRVHPQARPHFGYLGLAPDEGAEIDKTLPTVLSSMRQQGVIRRRSFGIYLDGEKGELLFGGYDQDRIKGKLKYSTMLNTVNQRIKDSKYPYSYDVKLTSLMRNGKDLLQKPGTRPRCAEPFSALMDTGYSYFVAPKHVYDALANDFKSTPIPGTRDSLVACDARAMKNVYTFDFNGVQVRIPGKAFVTEDLDGSGTCMFLASPSNREGRVVIGLPFFRYAYVYFDHEALQIGFAEQNKKATKRPNIVTGKPHRGPTCWVNFTGEPRC